MLSRHVYRERVLLRALNGTRDITSLLQEQKTLAAHIEGQGTDEAINDLKERLTVLVEELNQDANTWPAIREVASAARQGLCIIGDE